MDSYTVNKIAGAVFWSLLVIVGTKVLIEELSIPKHPEKPGYEIVLPDEKKAGQGDAKTQNASTATTTVSLGDMLSAGDAKRGAKVAKKCAGCHTFDKGGAKRVGPNLWGIVGHKIAGTEGFSYSPAMKKKDGNWTFAELKCFLENPKKCVPGTKMSYRGVRKPAQLADLLVYLNAQSDSPVELPK